MRAPVPCTIVKRLERAGARHGHPVFARALGARTCLIARAAPSRLVQLPPCASAIKPAASGNTRLPPFSGIARRAVQPPVHAVIDGPPSGRVPAGQARKRSVPPTDAVNAVHRAVAAPACTREDHGSRPRCSPVETGDQQGYGPTGWRHHGDGTSRLHLRRRHRPGHGRQRPAGRLLRRSRQRQLRARGWRRRCGCCCRCRVHADLPVAPQVRHGPRMAGKGRRWMDER